MASSLNLLQRFPDLKQKEHLWDEMKEDVHNLDGKSAGTA